MKLPAEAVVAARHGFEAHPDGLVNKEQTLHVAGCSSTPENPMEDGLVA